MLHSPGFKPRSSESSVWCLNHSAILALNNTAASIKGPFNTSIGQSVGLTTIKNWMDLNKICLTEIIWTLKKLSKEPTDYKLIYVYIKAISNFGWHFFWTDGIREVDIDKNPQLDAHGKTKFNIFQNSTHFGIEYKKMCTSCFKDSSGTRRAFCSNLSNPEYIILKTSSLKSLLSSSFNCLYSPSFPSIAVTITGS